MKTLAEQDLEGILNDISRLFNMVQNLSLFINDSRGIDREHLRAQLMEYKERLEQSYRLRDALLKNINKQTP